MALLNLVLSFSLALGVAGATASSAQADYREDRKAFVTNVLEADPATDYNLALRLNSRPEVGKETTGEARLAAGAKAFTLQPVKLTEVTVDEDLRAANPALADAIASGHAKIIFTWAKFTLANGKQSEALFQVCTVIKDGKESSGAQFVSAAQAKSIGWLDLIRPCCAACKNYWLAWIGAGWAEEACWSSCFLTGQCCNGLPGMVVITVAALNFYSDCCASSCKATATP